MLINNNVFIFSKEKCEPKETSSALHIARVCEFQRKWNQILNQPPHSVELMTLLWLINVKKLTFQGASLMNLYVFIYIYILVNEFREV